jgi:hypothetical protein
MKLKIHNPLSAEINLISSFNSVYFPNLALSNFTGDFKFFFSRRLIGFRQFHLEIDEKNYPENPVNPVRLINKNRIQTL